MVFAWHWFVTETIICEEDSTAKPKYSNPRADSRFALDLDTYSFC
jgi:hypothetical protein